MSLSFKPYPTEVSDISLSPQMSLCFRPGQNFSKPLNLQFNEKNRLLPGAQLRVLKEGILDSPMCEYVIGLPLSSDLTSKYTLNIRGEKGSLLLSANDLTKRVQQKCLEFFREQLPLDGKPKYKGDISCFTHHVCGGHFTISHRDGEVSVDCVDVDLRNPKTLSPISFSSLGLQNKLNVNQKKLNVLRPLDTSSLPSHFHFIGERNNELLEVSKRVNLMLSPKQSDLIPLLESSSVLFALTFPFISRIKTLESKTLLPPKIPIPDHKQAKFQKDVNKRVVEDILTKSRHIFQQISNIVQDDSSHVAQFLAPSTTLIKMQRIIMTVLMNRQFKTKRHASHKAPSSSPARSEKPSQSLKLDRVEQNPMAIKRIKRKAEQHENEQPDTPSSAGSMEVDKFPSDECYKKKFTNRNKRSRL